MEYTEEAKDAKGGTLEETIRYCHSEEMGNWVGTEGARGMDPGLHSGISQRVGW